ncbi:MAG: hypothetical protein M3417_07760 [Actinomycetota bacterium]|nr:hypothetical protein [Actinomycetota bacterium]
MRSILSGTRGLAPAILILIVVWALAAVLMLTGTLVAANQIDDSVAIIRPEVNDIGTDTEAIALAARTAKISGEIKRAAVPLTGQLSDTLAAAKDIDRVAKSILGTAGEINTTATTINGNVTPINTTVNAIGSSASSINTNVLAINRNARSINASARSINSHTDSINASARGIRGNAGTILAEVKTIDPEVAGINSRAEVVQDVGRSLGGDLSNVLRLVGGDGPNTINGHANSIDCSRLLNLLGPTQSCNR